MTEALLAPNAISKPYTFDIRGAGGFWAVEFDFPEAIQDQKQVLDFGLLVQAKALENGVVLMGFTGQPNKGSTILICPAYNVTADEIRTIAAATVKSIEQVLQDVLHK